MVSNTKLSDMHKVEKIQVIPRKVKNDPENDKTWE